MPTSTKATRERVYSGIRFCENLLLNKDRMVLAADARIGFGAGEDVSRLVDKVEAAVRRELALLLDIEAAHLAELADDPGVYSARHTAADDTRAAADRARSAVTLAYGAIVASQLGLESAMPEHHEELHRMALTVVERWASTKDTLPPAADGVDVQPFIDALAVEAAALGDTITQVAREEGEKRVTLERRREAEGSFDAVFSASATTGAAFLELAGKRTLAADLKPSRSRPGRSVAVAEGREVVPEDLDPTQPVAPAPAPAPAPAAEPGAGGES